MRSRVEILADLKRAQAEVDRLDHELVQFDIAATLAANQQWHLFREEVKRYPGCSCPPNWPCANAHCPRAFRIDAEAVA